MSRDDAIGWAKQYRLYGYHAQARLIHPARDVYADAEYAISVEGKRVTDSLEARRYLSDHAPKGT